MLKTDKDAPPFTISKTEKEIINLYVLHKVTKGLQT